MALEKEHLTVPDAEGDATTTHETEVLAKPSELRLLWLQLMDMDKCGIAGGRGGCVEVEEGIEGEYKVKQKFKK